MAEEGGAWGGGGGGAAVLMNLKIAFFSINVSNFLLVILYFTLDITLIGAFSAQL